MGSSKKDDPPKPGAWGVWTPALGLLAVGTVLAAGIVVGVLTGLYLDDRFETRPWCLVGGLFLGAAAGFWNMARMVKRFSK